MSFPERSPGAHPMLCERVARALESVAGERDPLRVVAALRAELGPELAREAAELHRLRAKAARKFPREPLLFLTTKGYEQASSELVASARARRIAGLALDAWLCDATCGVGGDSLALARAGLRVLAADRDPTALAYARANLEAHGRRAAFVRADAAAPAERAPFLVIDPDRRAARGRSLDPRSWAPPLARVLELARGRRGACVKLPPSFEPEVLGELPGARWQWVSQRGELAETCLWLGELAGVEAGAPARREALALGLAGGEARLEGEAAALEPWPPEAVPGLRWLAEPDPAVERAGLAELLAARTGLRPLAPGLGYLGGEERPEHPLLEVWRVLASVPLDRRRVRSMLAEHDVGELRVRRRGHPSSPEELARELRGRGSLRGTLLVARIARARRAFLVEPAHPARTGVVGDEGFEPPTPSL